MVIKRIQKLKLNMQTKDYVETENNYFTTKKSCLDLLKIHYQKYIVLHREQEYIREGFVVKKINLLFCRRYGPIRYTNSQFHNQPKVTLTLKFTIYH
jgi:hypothetical protein